MTAPQSQQLKYAKASVISLIKSIKYMKENKKDVTLLSKQLVEAKEIVAKLS